jgi:transposase
MLVVETIAKVRRDHIVDKKPIKAIARDRGLSRNTVRKVLRSGETSFAYEREDQPYPKLGPYLDELERLLAENEKRSRRERVTLLRLSEDLGRSGYSGGYDAVRRYAQRWRAALASGGSDAFIPLSFSPGEAYQFDWSHEIVVLGGVTITLKVAHVRLCHSRMMFVRAYPRETQEMVFDAHERAFLFFGGACTRGIYDNMKTAVDGIFTGKERRFNRRFEQMCSHYLVEPVACTPGAGWEKGQVENQVGTVRKRFFAPRLHFATLEELNNWLQAACVDYAKAMAHPEFKERKVWDVYSEEKAALVPWVGPFDGFAETTATASKTCLVRFDRNRYSVKAKAANRPVSLRTYAGRVEIRLDGEIVANHARVFNRDQVVYDPWHYLPVLARKPGALRNGAPFKNWELPPALARVRRRLVGSDDADRQFVAILAAVMDDGLEAVEAACTKALNDGPCGQDVVLNILARQREEDQPPPLDVPSALTLSIEPAADCARYDRLLPGLATAEVSTESVLEEAADGTT